MFDVTVHHALKARLTRSLFVALLVVGLALAALPAFADTQVIVPYAADGYTYLEIGYYDLPPAGFELPDFDDSMWATGTAGFGIGNGWDICLSPVLPSGSPWNVNSQLLVRKTFSLPARATNVQVGLAIDNDVRVWVNGHDVSGGLQRHTWCATRDSFIFTVDDAYINRGGENILAVQAFDYGILAYLDMQVTSDLLPTYSFSGFLPPIDPDAVNVVKAGAAVPVNFSLSGDQGLDIFAEGSPSSIQVACESGDTMNSVEETVTSGGSSLTYDPLTDQYTYVWKTDRAWAGTCRQLSVALDDDTVHTAAFQFK
jgi:hypothetical protein